VVEAITKELSQHLGSTGLLLVAVALLWQRAVAAERNSEKNHDDLWKRVNNHETRISHLE